MTSTAKKLIFATLILLLAVAAWQSILGDNMQVNIDGDEIDGPLGVLLGLVLAGGGMLIATVVIACVAVLLGIVFAGVGVLLVTALGLAAVVVAAAVSPLLLPLLIPFGIYWIFVGRARKQRQRALVEQPV